MLALILALVGTTLIVLALVLGPLLKPARAPATREAFDRAVYRDQLKELEREVARRWLERTGAEQVAPYDRALETGGPLEGPEIPGYTSAGPSEPVKVAEHILAGFGWQRDDVKLCQQMAPDDKEPADTLWVKSEVQRSCAKLIDARGKKSIGYVESHISAPFWIIYAVSFSFLAMLFGVFEARLINVVCTSLFYFAAGVTAMLIYAGSDPYHDPGRISAKSLTHLIDRMDAIDNGG